MVVWVVSGRGECGGDRSCVDQVRLAFSRLDASVVVLRLWGANEKKEYVPLPRSLALLLRLNLVDCRAKVPDLSVSPVHLQLSKLLGR